MSPRVKEIKPFLQSVPQAVTFEVPEKKPQNELYNDLNSAFAEVRLMLDGKKKEKTLDELIDELRNSND
jgi:hypothetical protein